MENKQLKTTLKTLDKVLKVLLILLVLLIIYLVHSIFKDWKFFKILIHFLKIISPLFIGFIFAWLFNPLVTKLEAKTNRIISTLIVSFGFIIFITLILYLFVPSFLSQLNSLTTTVPAVLKYLENTINNLFNNLANVFEYDLGFIKTSVFNNIGELTQKFASNLPDMVFKILKSLISGSMNILFGLVIGIYMLVDFNNIKTYLLKMIPTKNHKSFNEYTTLLNDTLFDYVKGTVFISILLFLLQSFNFTLIGLNAPLVFGMFCAITNIIPYIGPWIGGVPAIIVAFSISPLTGIFAIIAVIFAQSIENYILQPLVMGKTMNLHPVTIMISLLIFGNTFGILGMLFATPIVSAFKITINYIDSKYKLKEKLINN